MAGLEAFAVNAQIGGASKSIDDASLAGKNMRRQLYCALLLKKKCGIIALNCRTGGIGEFARRSELFERGSCDTYVTRHSVPRTDAHIACPNCKPQCPTHSENITFSKMRVRIQN